MGQLDIVLLLKDTIMIIKVKKKGMEINYNIIKWIEISKHKAP